MQPDSLTAQNKVDFNDVYTQADPRAYFQAFSSLDYQIPQHARTVVESVLRNAGQRDDSQTVVDVCCSYGMNGALLRYQTDLNDLNHHYTREELSSLDSDELLRIDQHKFAATPQRSDVSVLGLDTSQSAIEYGVSAGLLTDGWAENLEANEPSVDLRDGVKNADVVISTGGVGYIGPPTFEKLLNAIADPHEIWCAVFVLRVFDYKGIADLLNSYGLVTEHAASFPQRRFASESEQKAAIEDVQARGLDPAGKESDGWYWADCFISRPASEADIPLSEALALSR